ncbi:MAG TPA: sulfatase-like hydrolase/transferase, partial [Candidatus Limnocylindria bacterium]|nr:sulfatase-like hydrolase/transferase [Candidatus Limnocylindria bacterium]
MRRPRLTLGWLSSLPLHPLLVAAYPVVFLFAANAAEQITLEPLWRPLGMAVLAAALVMMLLYAITGNWRRAGLLTTVLLMGFFGYGHAWNAAAGVLDSQWPLIIAWALLVVIGLVAAWRAQPYQVPVTRGLNLVAALALILNTGSVAGTMVAFGAAPPTLPAADGDLRLAPADPDHPPDVYYIILDRYPGETALRETYGYDNAPFLDALEDRGFTVAHHAHANYIKTPLSLSSSLNLAYLDAGALEEEASSGQDREPVQRTLRDHLAVATALKSLGYRYYHISNWWTPTTTNVDADRVFHYEGQDEFSTVLAQTTLLRAFAEPEAAPKDPWDWDVLREHTLYELKALDEVPELPGPKFTFAHLLMPHPPWVIDADGTPMGRAQVDAQGDEESMVRYLRYANSRMLEAVDRILAESGDDAIIVIQADEGPFPARYQDDEWGFEWRDATDAELEEKFGILFAMRVAGADLDAAGFSQDITPVNTFRVIFNAAFGTDLPMMPNRSWAHE